MFVLTPTLHASHWGSTTAIHEFAQWPTTGDPLAEVWYGAHPSAPALAAAGSEDARSLREIIHADPEGILGQDVVARFGRELPFLLKIIAPTSPLSLQVHPSLEQAGLGWAREERAGVPLNASDRTYKDGNHKPEMLYALSDCEAVSGFRAPRRAIEVLTGLTPPLIESTLERLRQGTSAAGMRAAFEYVLLGARDRDEDVTAIVEQIRARLAAGESPSVHSDTIALTIAKHYPGDRGIVASLLLNPVTLRAGEALFIPAGCVHAYLSGLGVEVMANSDNVVRAGMTTKHVDARALLDILDVRPAPPIRLGPERSRAGVEVFYAPVEDFELAVIEAGPSPVAVGGAGPRIVLGIEGEVVLRLATREIVLRPAQAVLVCEGEVAEVSGVGRVVRASVP